MSLLLPAVFVLGETSDYNIKIVSLTLNVQAVGVFHSYGRIKDFVNDLNYRKKDKLHKNNSVKANKTLRIKTLTTNEQLKFLPENVKATLK